MNHSDDDKTFEASFEAYLSRLQMQTDNQKKRHKRYHDSSRTACKDSESEEERNRRLKEQQTIQRTHIEQESEEAKRERCCWRFPTH